MRSRAYSCYLYILNFRPPRQDARTYANGNAGLLSIRDVQIEKKCPIFEVAIMWTIVYWGHVGSIMGPAIYENSHVHYACYCWRSVSKN